MLLFTCTVFSTDLSAIMDLRHSEPEMNISVVSCQGTTAVYNGYHLNLQKPVGNSLIDRDVILHQKDTLLSD